MDISIIGSGALGKYYGGALSLKGHNVHFLVRSEYEVLTKAGRFTLNLYETSQKEDVTNLRLYQDPSDLPPSKLIIVSLKTTENAKIPELLRACRNDDSIILLIQNGLENEERLAPFTGSSRLLCGISMLGAVRQGSLQVDIAGSTVLSVAPFHTSAQVAAAFVKEAFAGSPIQVDVEISAEHRFLRWKKLCWNIPFGALCLMYDLPTNVIASEEPYRSLAYAMMLEIKTIAAADGFHLDDTYLKHFIELTTRSPRYFPSIYVDFKKGRKMETEYIFSNVLECAKRHSLFPHLLHMGERFLYHLEYGISPTFRTEKW